MHACLTSVWSYTEISTIFDEFLVLIQRGVMPDAQAILFRNLHSSHEWRTKHACLSDSVQKEWSSVRSI